MLVTITLIVVFLVVVALAAFLALVVIALLDARRSIGKIAAALETVAGHTTPLEQKLVTINGALSALAGELETADAHLGRAARAFRL